MSAKAKAENEKKAEIPLSHFEDANSFCWEGFVEQVTKVRFFDCVKTNLWMLYKQAAVVSCLV